MTFLGRLPLHVAQMVWKFVYSEVVEHLQDLAWYIEPEQLLFVRVDKNKIVNGNGNGNGNGYLRFQFRMMTPGLVYQVIHNHNWYICNLSNHQCYLNRLPFRYLYSSGTSMSNYSSNAGYDLETFMFNGFSLTSEEDHYFPVGK